MGARQLRRRSAAHSWWIEDLLVIMPVGPLLEVGESGGKARSEGDGNEGGNCNEGLVCQA
jgi:hypothetical protein